MRVTGWEVDADELMGLDHDGAEYYRLGGGVYKVRDGYTRWCSTVAGWPLIVKVHKIILVST